jgi:hypothetical protein
LEYFRALTVIQRGDKVGEHPQQVTKVDRREKQGEIEEKELSYVHLKMNEEVEGYDEDNVLERNEGKIDENSSKCHSRWSIHVEGSYAFHISK